MPSRNPLNSFETSFLESSGQGAYLLRVVLAQSKNLVFELQPKARSMTVNSVVDYFTRFCRELGCPISTTKLKAHIAPKLLFSPTNQQVIVVTLSASTRTRAVMAMSHLDSILANSKFLSRWTRTVQTEPEDQVYDFEES